MRRRWRVIVAILSFAMFALVVAAWVRGYFVQDSVWVQNWAEQPMTAEAREYARARRVEADFIGYFSFRSLSLLRGIILIRQHETWNVMCLGRERESVKNPKWQWIRGRAGGARPAFEPTGRFRWLGFAARANPPRPSEWKEASWDVHVPLWPFALMTALLPATWLRRRLRNRRRRLNRMCVACGYDLHGIDHRRCPECGMLPAATGTMDG